MKRIAIAAALSVAFFSAGTPTRAQRASDELSLPSGWVGVGMQQWKDDAGKVLEYPVIVSVNHNSPADSAGLAPGDTVLKFDHIDAHANPSGLSRLLQPGRRIRLKLRHNGVRTVTVIARERPPQFEMSFKESDDLDEAGVADVFLEMLAPIAAPTAMRVTMVVAGASLAQMNADLAEALHAQNQGVLVLKVAPATPAMRAGLKGGDIIVNVDATRVTGPAIIFLAMSFKTAQDSADRRIALDVVRMGRERRVTLRW